MCQPQKIKPKRKIELDPVLKVQLEQCVSSINDTLKTNTPKVSFTGLLHGNTGAALFHAYYYQLNRKKESKEELDSLLERILEELSRTDQLATFGTGFTGFSWLIYHLVHLNILKKEDSAILDHVEPLIINSFNQDFQNNHYDLFYGYIGKSLFFLEKNLISPTSSSFELLRRCYECLRDTAIKSESGVSWSDPDRKNHVVNLGLAHGVPSILSFLINLSDHRVLTKEEIQLIKNGVLWLLNKETNFGRSAFGTTAAKDVDPHDSRLAWCYGDLGIAFVLAKAAIVFDRKEWMQKSISLGIEASKRDLKSGYIDFDEKNNIHDIHFCHGSSGVAYLFNRLYQLTGESHFKKTSLIWVKETVSNTKKLIAQYAMNDFKTLNINDQMIYIQELSLLDGLAGVGLVLMSILDEKLHSWNRIFLLN